MLPQKAWKNPELSPACLLCYPPNARLYPSFPDTELVGGGALAGAEEKILGRGGSMHHCEPEE